MIDIHSHILPGVDDGARDLQEAVAMLRLAAEAGTTDIVASSHANDEFRFDPEQAALRVDALQAAAGPVPRVHYGCEMHLSIENLQAVLKRPADFTIGHLSYLLVELPEGAIPRTCGEIFARLMAAGLRPVIVHPERNRAVRAQAAELKRWIELGCLVQVTGQALLGGFGSAAKVASEQWIGAGFVHAIASDGHRSQGRVPVLAEARRFVDQRFGAEVARRLFLENPQAIVHGEPLEAVAPARRRRWFSPWH